MAEFRHTNCAEGSSRIRKINDLRTAAGILITLAESPSSLHRQNPHLIPLNEPALLTDKI